MLKPDFVAKIGMRSMKIPVILSVSLMVLASLLLSSSIVHAQAPDFAINSTPSVLCVNPGINAVSSISLQSVDGFAGTVNLGSSVQPSMNNSPTLSSIPASETLSAGQTIDFNLTISTTTSTPIYTFSIVVSGFSGSYHQTTIYLTVATGCSVGGVVVPIAGLAHVTPYIAYSLAIAGLVGIVGATLAISVSRRKPSPNL